GYSSHIEIPVLEGEEILIRVGGWQEGDAGSGTLRISCSSRSACCFDDGSCQLNGDLECTDAGGAWQGNGTTCDDVACPQPGACCFMDETCDFVLEPDCIQAKGTFQGELTDCKTSDCSLTPGNDFCEDAWLIEDGDTEFSTLHATTDGVAHDECKWTGQTFNDIWFQYTATCSGLLTVSTCNLANYDTDLVLYEGWNCEELVFIGCNDDGGGCEGYTSHMEVDITSGQNITIRVGGWKDGNVGTGVLRVECESSD
ncbi:MAG: hypothetical protein VX527_10735, partial [Planctomycetota bacterium]|nr:hypothetical protein [Planctomycetota bacterium]